MDSPKTLLSDLTSSKVRRAPSREGRPTPRALSGFTLAELIVVVSILAVLATIGFLALSGYQQDAKKAVAATNVNSVYTAISTEASVTGNSARYYVIHDPNYALTGSVIVFDGIPASLVGGDWNAPGTNYSAGNPDYAKLKLDPAKFRITSVRTYASDLFAAIFSPFSVRSASADSVSSDPSYLLVGAVDAADTSGTKTRVKSYSQVAAILPSGETQINGDYPVTATGGSTPGLIKDVANVGSSTGTLVDGATVGSIPGCDADSDFSGYAVPSMASGESKPVLKTTANGRINATATCSFGTVSISSEAADCDPTYVPVSGLACAKNECGGTAPSTIPNAESNAVSQTLGTDWHYSATPGVCTYSCATTAPGYVWDTGSSSCKQNCDPVAAQTWSGTAYALSSIAALVHGASGNFSGSGSFGGSYPANGTLTADFALSCDNGTLSSVATPGTGTCNTNYTWNGNWTAPNCILDSYAVSGSFGAGGSGATVSGCSGASATADSSGTFSFANVPHGTACNDISAVRTGYLCATTTNGPSSLIANVTSIAGNCALTVNGACGTANKSYAYTATGYLSDSFCLSGTLSPASVAFPTAG
ncbi:MAG: hypothetical protein QG650_698 [Patescibacteria group bacterium]|nr:hypothetical protein [Patescibacteria group bacterium]